MESLPDPDQLDRAADAPSAREFSASSRGNSTVPSEWPRQPWAFLCLQPAFTAAEERVSAIKLAVGSPMGMPVYFVMHTLTRAMTLPCGGPAGMTALHSASAAATQLNSFWPAGAAMMYPPPPMPPGAGMMTPPPSMAPGAGAMYPPPSMGSATGMMYPPPSLDSGAGMFYPPPPMVPPMVSVSSAAPSSAWQSAADEQSARQPRYAGEPSMQFNSSSFTSAGNSAFHDGRIEDDTMDSSAYHSQMGSYTSSQHGAFYAAQMEAGGAALGLQNSSIPGRGGSHAMSGTGVQARAFT